MFRSKIFLCLSCPKYPSNSASKKNPIQSFLWNGPGKMSSCSSSGIHPVHSHNVLTPVNLNHCFEVPPTQRRKLSIMPDVKCWNCHQTLEYKKFSCALCGALQYPKKNLNYFELFGVSQTFDMDLENLSTKFKEMQKTFHPDKFANKTKEEMEISESYSRLVNLAYTTLKEPLKRGFYLLELKNLPKDDQFPIAQEFLTSVMEKNEELDTINTKANLDRFMKANNAEIKKHINIISESFYSNNWVEAKVNLQKLNYFINLEQKVKKKVTDLLSTKEK